MGIFSTLTILIFTALLGSGVVNGLESSTRTHYLLRTNALNYLGFNLELDDEVYGSCIDGPPEGGSRSAPDAQTTRDDYDCMELGACHVGFTQV